MQKTMDRIIIPRGIFDYKAKTYSSLKPLQICNDVVIASNTKSMLAVKQQNKCLENETFCFDQYDEVVRLKNLENIKGDLILEEVTLSGKTSEFKIHNNTYSLAISKHLNLKDYLIMQNYKTVIENLNSDFLVASQIKGRKHFKIDNETFSIYLSGYKEPLVKQELRLEELKSLDCACQYFDYDFKQEGLDIKKAFTIAFKDGEKLKEVTAITQGEKTLVYLPIYV